MQTAPPLLQHPSKRIRLIEDWISGTTAGNLNWSNENAGAGAAPALTETNVDANHAGILELHTGSTATGRSGTALGASATVHSILPSGGYGFQEWLVRIPLASTSAERFAICFGFGDIFNAAFTNGVFLCYEEVTSPNWIARTSNSAVSTNTDTGVPVAIDSWIKLRIEHNTNLNRKFYINGTLVATHTTNIATIPISPTANLRKSVGTTSRLVYIDYFMLDHIFTTAR